MNSLLLFMLVIDKTATLVLSRWGLNFTFHYISLHELPQTAKISKKYF